MPSALLGNSLWFIRSHKLPQVVYIIGWSELQYKIFLKKWRNRKILTKIFKVHTRKFTRCLKTFDPSTINQLHRCLTSCSNPVAKLCTGRRTTLHVSVRLCMSVIYIYIYIYIYILIWFLCSMGYQFLLVIQSQSYPCRRTAVIILSQAGGGRGDLYLSHGY